MNLKSISLKNIQFVVRIKIIILVALLFVLLPIYTPVTIFLINRFSAPYWIVYWKELLAGAFIFLASVDLFVIQFKTKWQHSRLLWPLAVFGICFAWIAGISLLHHTAKTSLMYGIRFELWWVLIYSAALSWWQSVKIDPDWKQVSRYFQQMVQWSVYVGLAVSVTFALGIYAIGQSDVLARLGYGQYSGSSAYLNPVLCHPVDAFSESCRLSGGFTLPNHYAGYLLLMLGYLLFQIVRGNKKRWQTGLLVLSSIIVTITIILTSSRFSLLGLAIFAGYLAFWVVFKNINKLPVFNKEYLTKLYKICFVLLLFVPAIIGAVGINQDFQKLQGLPTFIGKPYSTSEHYRRTAANLEIISDSPVDALFGYGAGSSGPAAKPEYVDLKTNPLYKKYSYLETKYNVGDGLFVPENWFIQLILNGGIFYALIYVFLVGYPVWKMLTNVIFGTKSLHQFITSFTKPENAIYIGMFTIIVGNLFLHIWENQTLAVCYALIFLASETD